ncbi:hypothetical protein GOBAR_AA19264 [Gossypium barbadense]|uniref:UBC core domain-containing protein n=1 Tax=Gossypium barbadense TaxID=3634 RepID=A0A2P5XDL3_GOSBA|nr:hypothetical protein GOBAR_AA19264 [Gossypium barbadense]
MEVRPNQTVDNSSTSPQQHRHRVAAAASKQPVSATNAVDTTSVTQRLQKELMALMMSSGDLGVSAFPEGESIFTWIGTIKGGEGTMYEGLSYKLSLRFPLDYPFKPPQVKFETTCFHPNVDQFGNICLDILQKKQPNSYISMYVRHRGIGHGYIKKRRVETTYLEGTKMVDDKWSSAYDCRTILLSVQSLLGEPNPESPLNTYAAALWNNKEDVSDFSVQRIRSPNNISMNNLRNAMKITERWSKNSILVEKH